MASEIAKPENNSNKQESSTDKQTLLAVLQFLRKNNLKVSSPQLFILMSNLLFDL